jgi:hypothetical protein
MPRCRVRLELLDRSGLLGRLVPVDLPDRQGRWDLRDRQARPPCLLITPP